MKSPAIQSRGTTGFLAVTFVLLWNSGFIGAEYALPYAPPFTLLFWRYWFLVLFIGVSLLLIRPRVRIPIRAVGMGMLVGALAHGIWLGGVCISILKGVPAGIVALIVALQPMATGALSGPTVGEKTPFWRWIGLGIGFFGVMVTVLARIEFKNSDSVLAYGAPFVSVMAITIASLIERRIEITGGQDRLPLRLNLFFQCLGAALIVTFPAIGLEELETVWNPSFVVSLIWLSFGVSFGAYGVMWILIKRIDATRVATLFYFGPPVTLLIAWLAFGDRIETTDLVGLAIIAAGVVLSQR